MARAVALKNFDWLIFLVVCLMLIVSFFFVWSASSGRYSL